MSQFVSEVLKAVAQGETLSAAQAENFMNLLMSGHISPIQTAGLVAAMAVRGETVDEIVGFARSMRQNAVSLEVPLDVVDTCGTGGDGADTFNISTTAAIVAAAAGVPIAKHGNRAVSSKSGSADVLVSLGARVDLDEEAARSCLLDTNLCFMFAPSFHPAMKNAAETRKQLGFRTIFNILGPLTNPAGAKRQVLGVFRADLVNKVAEALLKLGSTHALVVHGGGGIDEISLQGETIIAEVKDGAIREYTVTARDFGCDAAPLSTVTGGDSARNANILKEVLSGATGPHRDIVVMNAGAALYVGGKATSLLEGAQMANQVIDDGTALATLGDFVDATHKYHQSSEVAQ